jgi:hypothetical protein
VEQVDVLKFAIDVLERMGVPYMVVGAFASGPYGEPRMTQDIDIVVDRLGLGHIWDAATRRVHK